MAMDLAKTGQDGQGNDRLAEVQARALSKLDALLGPLTDGLAKGSTGDDEDVVDLRIPETGEDVSSEVAGWVTVAQAAERAGVSTSTVRQWYRSGRLPTQRSEGGGFLVPLDDVVRLASMADEAGDPGADPIIDINASYWSAETEAARADADAARAEATASRAEAMAATARADSAEREVDAANERAALAAAELDEVRQELAEARLERVDIEREVDFLRGQLVEVGEESRKLHDRVGDLERELTLSRTFGSVTDPTWVASDLPGYRGPNRRQGLDEGAEDEAAAPLAFRSEEPFAVDEFDDEEPSDEPAWDAHGNGQARDPLADRPTADDLLPAIEPKKKR